MELEASRSQTRVDNPVIGDLFLTMAMKDRAALLRAIAAAGVDVNVASPKGKTLLLLAVELASICDYKLRRRMMAGICCLLDHGADPNLADDRGETPLSVALQFRQRDLTELLFLSGAQPKSRIH